MPRHFLSQNDISPSEVNHVLNQAANLRSEPISDRLKNRSMVMFFEKTSTRTRLSFEIGMTQLGGHAVYLDRDSSQLSRGESLRDLAMVVSQYSDIMMARVNSHESLIEMATYAAIPLINGLSDAEHPMQSLSDIFTIRDRTGGLSGVNVGFVGDGDNNVAHSLLLACSLVGTNISVASPPGMGPQPRFVDLARQNANASGSKITVSEDPVEAVTDADVVYTDVWVSMGRDEERAHRLGVFEPYQINGRLLSNAKSDYIFMHCLPQHIGEEVTAEVAYGPHSVVFEQAQNRLHAQKAMILFLLEGERSDG